jgi:hypothetical protein
VDVDGTLVDFEDWLALYQERSKFGGDQLISILYRYATWQVNARKKFEGPGEVVREISAGECCGHSRRSTTTAWLGEGGRREDNPCLTI